ncbi:hypothetical protein KB221_08390 [Aquidulcibacter paucihalophilus]|nr:hypothetical protein KB221_08390 [Aquidulcibacter paucihalophilus]
MTFADLSQTRDLASLVRRRSESLPPIGDEAFAAAFDVFADARVVLLGECTHGTAEFYEARAAIDLRPTG